MYRETFRLNKLNVQSAEADINSVQKMYELGSATILEVLNAQRSYIEAKSDLISTKYDAKITETKLKYQMGTL